MSKLKILDLWIAGLVAAGATGAWAQQPQAPTADPAQVSSKDQNAAKDQGAKNRGAVLTKDRTTAALPICTLAPDDSSKLAVQPCQPAPLKRPRRAVAQVIGRMPARPPSGAYANRVVIPSSAGTFAASPSSSKKGPTTGPVPLIGCETGVCRDAAGGVHTFGVGNSSVNAQGKLCNRNGVWLQCF